jgi:hypothetical protein
MQKQRRVGASTATLTITLPQLSDDGISPLRGTRLHFPAARGDMRDPDNQTRPNLRRVLPSVHEYAHYFDLYTTDVGFALSLVDHLRISRNLFLLNRLKEHPVAPKISIPLAKGVLEKN